MDRQGNLTPHDLNKLVLLTKDEWFVLYRDSGIEAVAARLGLSLTQATRLMKKYLTLEQNDVCVKARLQRRRTSFYDPAVRDKARKVIKERYGVDNPVHDKVLHEKMAEARGLKAVALRGPEMLKAVHAHLDPAFPPPRKIGREHWHLICDLCGNHYESYQAKGGGYLHVCPKCKTPGYRSLGEKILEKWFREHGYVFYTNYRHSPFEFPATDTAKAHVFELDFYLPQQHLAIELNGEPYHTEGPLWHKRYTPDEYHALKEKICRENGVTLVYLWYLKTNHYALDKMLEELKEFL